MVHPSVPTWIRAAIALCILAIACWISALAFGDESAPVIEICNEDGCHASPHATAGVMRMSVDHHEVCSIAQAPGLRVSGPDPAPCVAILDQAARLARGELKVNRAMARRRR